MTDVTPPSAPFMPEAEAAHLRDCYEAASVILEYGAGGSTRLAAGMAGKYVLSVESDPNWARQLRHELSTTQPPPASLITVYHVDIGPTGAWGRPKSEAEWRAYHRYPNAIWDEPFFLHPDLVLIDGRFRVACLMAVALHAQRPVRVLFDDYGDRPKYRRAEAILQPRRMIGRMAEFMVEPGMVNSRNISYMIAQYFDVTVVGAKRHSYELSAEDLRALQVLAPEGMKGNFDDHQAHAREFGRGPSSDASAGDPLAERGRHRE